MNIKISISGKDRIEILKTIRGAFDFGLAEASKVYYGEKAISKTDMSYYNIPFAIKVILNRNISDSEKLKEIEKLSEYQKKFDLVDIEEN